MKKLVFKVIILFLILFNFKIPVINNSVFLAMIIASLYYLFVRRFVPLTYFTFRYSATILIATLCMALISFFVTVSHTTSFTLFSRRFLIILQMLLTIIYVLPILLEDKKNAFEESIVLICYAFALQGLIHFLGYSFPVIGEFVFSLHSGGLKEVLLSGQTQVEKFRFYALCGSIFFELPAAYGAVFILYFRLLMDQSRKYFNGYVNFFVFVLMFLGIMLSGRTGFVGFFIGLAFYFYYLSSHLEIIQKNFWRLSVYFITLLVIFNFAFPGRVQRAIVDEVFPFAFEAYYNLRDRGTFSTTSTDMLTQGHYFYLDDDMLIKGEGVGAYETGQYFSDSGYMKLLFFGGIPFLIIVVIYQCLYFFPVFSVVRKKNSIAYRRDYQCFLLLFLYIFILTYKESAIGTTLMVETVYFYAGTSHLLRHYELFD